MSRYIEMDSRARQAREQTKRPGGRQPNWSRRKFLKGAFWTVAAAAGGGLGFYLIAESNKRQKPGFETEDQKAARDFFDAAQNGGETVEVTVVNNDDTKQPVNVRKNPAVLYDNIITKVKPSEKFEAIVVGPVAGLQQTDPNLAGVWVAIEIDKTTAKIGFIHSNYIKRTDGQALTAGQKIYNLRTDEDQPR